MTKVLHYCFLFVVFHFISQQWNVYVLLESTSQICIVFFSLAFCPSVRTTNSCLLSPPHFCELSRPIFRSLLAQQLQHTVCRPAEKQKNNKLFVLHGLLIFVGRQKMQKILLLCVCVCVRGMRGGGRGWRWQPCYEFPKEWACRRGGRGSWKSCWLEKPAVFCMLWLLLFLAPVFLAPLASLNSFRPLFVLQI